MEGSTTYYLGIATLVIVLLQGSVMVVLTVAITIMLLAFAIILFFFSGCKHSVYEAYFEILKHVKGNSRDYMNMGFWDGADNLGRCQYQAG